MFIVKLKSSSKADPGIVIEGHSNPLDGGTDPTHLIHLLKNPMKLKKFPSIGAPPSLRSAAEIYGKARKQLRQHFFQMFTRTSYTTDYGFMKPRCCILYFPRGANRWGEGGTNLLFDQFSP